MLSKIQNFGSAMLCPVMFMAFAGVAIGLSVFFTSGTLLGDWASDENGLWFQCWNVISAGGWTVIKQIPLVFAIGLPIGLAKKANARACIEVLITFITFHYFVNTMITTWPELFHNIDLTVDVDSSARLAMIANIPTLNMGVFGALLVSGITVFLHNRYYDKKLPVALSVFSGSVFVYTIAFVVMLPLAFLTSLFWPYVQDAIFGIGSFVNTSGPLGMWIYIFLEKGLLPFGIHSMLWMPMEYDNLVMDGGITANWLAMLPQLATDPTPIKDVIPEVRFGMTNPSRIFGATGICAAMYVCAKPENRKMVLGVLIPAWVSAVFCAISEPLEFTFLFVAPALFYVHAALAATMSTLMFELGGCGLLSDSLFHFISQYAALVQLHWREILIIVVVGLAFMVIYFFVFTAWIKKFNVPTPGRTDEAEMRLRTKKEYRDQQNNKENDKAKSLDSTDFVAAIEEGVGGRDNIDYLTNCISRLRITVKDTNKLKDDSYFKEVGAKGAVKVDKTIQIIIGTDVPQVRTKFEEYIDWE